MFVGGGGGVGLSYSSLKTIHCIFKIEKLTFFLLDK